MKYIYETEGTCCRFIQFKLENDIVSEVEFLGGGCPGNLQALPKLVESMTVSEIKSKLGGIICGNKTTSCPDQLAKAVCEVYEKKQAKDLKK